MLPKFRYHRAGTMDEALRLIRDNSPDVRVLAGGTDLLISMKQGTCAPKHVVDLKVIPELRRLETGADGGVTVGACVTVNELLEFAGLPAGAAALRDAASVLATYQLRNRATVGGNICNASPACDLGPPLLVLGAEVHVVSASGERRVPLAEFFTSVKQTCLAPEEVITWLSIPPLGDTVSAFVKRQRIRGHDLATVNVAAAAGGGRPLRLGLGAVATRPLLVETPGAPGSGLRAPGAAAGKELRGAATAAALAAIAPIDDVRAGAEYRRHMISLMVGKAIDLLEARAGGRDGGR
jgi:CO/xanthine dehydrogenase FAD-binding subunit